MAGAIDLAVYKDGLLILGTAAVVVPVMHRLKQSPVLGFLVTGALLGPFGIGAFADTIPALEWVSIQSSADITLFAELGVVFLLFLIGLELSLERLTTMRRLVFGFGAAQVLLSVAAIAGIAYLFGNGAEVAVVVGTALALSSTAIVVEILAHQKRLATATGRGAFSVLIFQDIAVVPILFLVGVLGVKSEGGVLTGLATALAQAVVAIVVILVVGRLMLRPFFRFVAETQSAEGFMAAAILVVVGTGVLAGAFGLSMALGAFLAGLLLAETEYRRQIEATIEPFKGLLLGVFFLSVGMQIDFGRIAAEPFWVPASVAGLIALKMAIVTPLARVFGFSWSHAMKIGLLLGPAGEFGFVVVGMAVSLGLIAADVGGFMIIVATLSMALIPAMDRFGRVIAQRAAPPQTAAPPEPPPEDGAARAILVGYGRVGQLVGDMLAEHRVPYIAVDTDVAEVSRARGRGRPVYFGDATNRLFLERCGLANASALVITIHTSGAMEEIIRQARSIRPDLVVIARTRDASHARKLYQLGVTDAVPETIEASLQLSEAALVGLGVPVGPVIASIHEKRDVYRRELQKAAGEGARGRHGIKAKTNPKG